MPSDHDLIQRYPRRYAAEMAYQVSITGSASKERALGHLRDWLETNLAPKNDFPLISEPPFPRTSLGREVSRLVDRKRAYTGELFSTANANYAEGYFCQWPVTDVLTDREFPSLWEETHVLHEEE